MQMNATKTKNYFNPHIAFFSLPIVFWTIRIGLTLIIIMSLIIVIFDPRPFDISASGFNELLSIFKAPITLLGFFAALLALFATNHRSEQNKEAMELTASQNRFSNYYKHIEEYKSYIDTHFNNEIPDQNPSVRVRRLHKALYPKAKTNGVNLSEKMELEIFSITFKFINSITATDFSDKESVQKLVLHIDDCVTSVSALLLDSVTFEKFSHVEINFFIADRTIKVPDALLSAYLQSGLKKLTTINEILYFEEDFNFELLESLLFHTKHTISFIPKIILMGHGDVEYSESLDQNESDLNKINQECKNLIVILENIKKNFPKYNP